MRRREGVPGMTMIEAVIASTIFALVIAMSFAILHWTTQSFNEQIREATLTDKGEKVIKAIQEEMTDATSVMIPNFSVSNGYTFYRSEIRFKVPKRFTCAANPSGYAVTIAPVDTRYYVPTFSDDKDFTLKYGWRDNLRMVPNLDDGSRAVPLQGPGLKTGATYCPPGVTLSSNVTPDGFMCFRFVMNTKVQMGKFGTKGVLDEAQERIDVDGDKAFTSKFALGYMERCYAMGNETQDPLVPVGESRQPLGDSWVLQPILGAAPVTGEDPTTVATNRIFTDVSPTDPKNLSCIQACVWLLTMDSAGQPHLMKCTTDNFQRNSANYVTATSATGTQ